MLESQGDSLPEWEGRVCPAAITLYGMYLVHGSLTLDERCNGGFYWLERELVEPVQFGFVAVGYAARRAGLLYLSLGLFWFCWGRLIGALWVPWVPRVPLLVFLLVGPLPWFGCPLETVGLPVGVVVGVGLVPPHPFG